MCASVRFGILSMHAKVTRGYAWLMYFIVESNTRLCMATVLYCNAQKKSRRGWEDKLNAWEESYGDGEVSGMEQQLESLKARSWGRKPCRL